jgi:hypothetical protein
MLNGDLMPPYIFFGPLRDHYLVLFAAAGTIAAVVGFVAAWLGAQFGGKRAARLAAEEALAANRAMLGQDLMALVQAVDAIALEVERLSEGQRFTARLLAERPLLGSTTARPASGFESRKREREKNQ